MIRSLPVFLSSLLLLGTTTTTTDAVGCDLACQNQAPCVQGNADYSDHPTTVAGDEFEFHQETASAAGMHCACPHGWTGLLCNIPYLSCDYTHRCYHGGTCIPGLDDEFGNEQLYCDCSSAVDENGKEYAGKWCERRRSDYCDDTQEHFCLNDGRCNDEYPSSGEPCQCLSNYYGDHCEYEEGGGVPKCTKDCKNGGQCVLMGMAADNNKRHDYYWAGDDPDDTDDHMQCQCPPDYDGEYCEIPRVPCGNDNDGDMHYCFNGGTCVQRVLSNGELHHHCDCSSAQTDAASYAGLYCQYRASSYCSKDNGLNGHLFCVNGGKCQSDPYLGCDCTLTGGYSGFSCEFLTSSVVDATNPPPVSSEGGGSGGTTTSGSSGTTEWVGGTPGTNAGDSATGTSGGSVEWVGGTPGTNAGGSSGGTTTGGGTNSNVTEWVGGSPGTNAGQYGQFRPPPPPPPQQYDPDDAAVCDLLCDNGGVCRYGAKDWGDDLQEIVDNAPDLGNETADENFQHCVCPDGYNGLTCQYQVQVCPDGQHLCLHGSQCVQIGNEQACDCAEANIANNGPGDDQLYVGDSCEHTSNDICTIGHTGPGQPLSFCVNGGTCKRKVTEDEDHPGCNCPEGWKGPHCELRDSLSSPVQTATTTTTTTTEQQEGSSSTMAPAQAFGVAVLVIGVLSLLAVTGCFVKMCCERRNRKRRQELLSHQLSWEVQGAFAGSYRDHPASPLRRSGTGAGGRGKGGPEVNIAPRGSSSDESPPQKATEIHSAVAVYPVQDHDSSRDPMATHLAPNSSNSNTGSSVAAGSAAVAAAATQAPATAAPPPSRAGPEVYIGPPRDEDGHELHNVNII